MNKRDRYNSLIMFYADDIGDDAYDWRWARAQLEAESGMDPAAISPCGAEGLGQSMPGTFREFSERGDPFNPETAIHFHAWYLRKLLRLFDGDIVKASAAYNAGPGRLRSLLKTYGDGWRHHLPAETCEYLERIEGLYALGRGL